MMSSIWRTGILVGLVTLGSRATTAPKLFAKKAGPNVGKSNGVLLSHTHSPSSRVAPVHNLSSPGSEMQKPRQGCHIRDGASGRAPASQCHHSGGSSRDIHRRNQEKVRGAK